MRKLIKKLIALSIVTTTILAMSVTGASASWKQNSDNSWSNTEVSINYTGWYNDNGTWYYFKNSIMQIGWINDNGKWYYLSSSGSMQHDTIIEGYRLGSDGAWVVATPIASTTTTNNKTNNTSSTSNETIVLDSIGEINPIKPADAYKYGSTKMTIFFNKNTGIIDTIVSGISDLNAYNKRNDKDLYNYAVIDYNENILCNAGKLCIKNGKLVKK